MIYTLTDWYVDDITDWRVYYGYSKHTKTLISESLTKQTTFEVFTKIIASVI